MMKLAVTGKGGTGKTTLAALLISRLAARGRRVIAIDADPDANLASALGFEDAASIVPIAEMSSLIEERTGATIGEAGSFFRINPDVDDLPEKLWREKGNIRLMVMGTVKRGGSGCVCPESALVKALVSHVVYHRDDAVVMDMEAGVEHLGRGTAAGVDAMIVVVEPGRRSIETAAKIRALAADLGVKRIAAAGNKARGPADEAYIRENLTGIELLGVLPYDESLIEADCAGRGIPEAFADIIDAMIDRIGGKAP